MANVSICRVEQESNLQLNATEETVGGPGGERGF